MRNSILKRFIFFLFFYIVLPAIKNRRYPPVDLEFIMKISSTQHDFFITKEQNLFTCRKIKFLKNIANFLVSRKWEWNRIEKKYLTRWRNNFQFTSIPRHTDERLQLITSFLEVNSGKKLTLKYQKDASRRNWPSFRSKFRFDFTRMHTHAIIHLHARSREATTNNFIMLVPRRSCSLIASIAASMRDPVRRSDLDRERNAASNEREARGLVGCLRLFSRLKGS